MATTLANFWKNPAYYKDTKILQDEYTVLEKAGLLISEAEIKNNDGELKIHPMLPAEPFMGDLDNAKVYIFMLNPRAGTPYKAEYKNWQNTVLLDKWQQNLNQQKNRQYPFYYLDPQLATTGGGKWWLLDKGLDKIISRLKTNKPNNTQAFVSQSICSIELCPYHSTSAKWNPKQKKAIYSLPSVLETIKFLRDYIIPRVIKKECSLLITRSVSDINKLLSDAKFIYNGKENSFYDLERDFPDRVVFYKTAGLAQSASLNPDVEKAKGGKMILEALK